MKNLQEHDSVIFLQIVTKALGLMVQGSQWVRPQHNLTNCCNMSLTTSWYGLEQQNT